MESQEQCIIKYHAHRITTQLHKKPWQAVKTLTEQEPRVPLTTLKNEQKWVWCPPFPPRDVNTAMADAYTKPARQKNSKIMPA